MFGHDVGRLNKSGKREFHTICRRSIRWEFLDSQELEEVPFFLYWCYLMNVLVITERLHFVALVFGHMFPYYPYPGRKERRRVRRRERGLGYLRQGRWRGCRHVE